MTSTRFEAAVRRATRERHGSLATDLQRMRLDAGVPVAALATAAGVDRAYLHRILDGRESPTVETYQRLALALGADLSARLYPSTGPAIRNRHQAPILELILGTAHPRWDRYIEVAVRRPSRGWIDLLLHGPRERIAVATEIESELRRLEQQIRWSVEKVASLPSWDGWAQLGEQPQVSRLLVVRRTRATRAIAQEFAAQLRTAYPAHPDDALAALTGTAPWPGPALVWVARDPRGTRFAHGR